MTYNVFSGTLNPTQSIKHWCRRKSVRPIKVVAAPNPEILSVNVRGSGLTWNRLGRWMARESCCCVEARRHCMRMLAWTGSGTRLSCWWTLSASAFSTVLITDCPHLHRWPSICNVCRSYLQLPSSSCHLGISTTSCCCLYMVLRE